MKMIMLSFGLWCLTLISTIFQLHRDSQFYCEETRVSGENQ
jgi:hypothetical protein